MPRRSNSGSAKTSTCVKAEPSASSIQGELRRSKRQKTIPKEDDTVEKFKVPSTPVKSRSTPGQSKSPVSKQKIPSRKAPSATNGTPLKTRPADPHSTNATLVTPGGTQAVANPPELFQTSPSKTLPNGPRPTANTDNILSQACAHLISVDPKMGPLIEKHPCDIFSPAGLAERVEPFEALASGIISQQVSGAAAASIKRKFVALFDDEDDAAKTASFPTPAKVAATDLTVLRSAGLSQRKAEYIQGLAEKFASGDLSTAMLLRASDEEVLEKLIAVRGLGKWSVEMFSCFSLKRMDVFSTGDLGVQRGMAAFAGKDVAKLKAKGGGKWKYMSEKDMLEGSERFKPYRSLFMWYMWRAEGVDVSAVQGSA